MQDSLLERVIKSSKEAESAQRMAEELVRQRQQDLMTLTHQMVGALVSVIGALSGIERSHLSSQAHILLDHAQNLVEDAIAIAYGSFTSLAHEAGRDTAFRSSRIDAPEAIKKLFRRLQMTNAREDLTASFTVDPSFPTLVMDKNAFTSMMFTLIHNAMKYSDLNSRVAFDFAVDRDRKPILRVKSVGVPIRADEKDAIFDKFRRGKSVEHGRYYGGVGLGLWVARELIRAVGGDISLELSASNSRIATFVVRLPHEVALSKEHIEGSYGTIKNDSLA